jgi:hypothetical protein
MTDYRHIAEEELIKELGIGKCLDTTILWEALVKERIKTLQHVRPTEVPLVAAHVTPRVLHTCNCLLDGGHTPECNLVKAALAEHAAAMERLNPTTAKGEDLKVMLKMVEPRSCNRHHDCDKAEKDYLARHPEHLGNYISNFHCHDDECEDCFGS